ELATMRPSLIARLVLVSPAGIKPREGQIFDQFLVTHKDYILAGFHDPAKAHELWGEEFDVDQLVAWDVGREMIARIAWKPYLFTLQLPHILSEITIPTLVVWGDNDRIIPSVCGQQFFEALPNARLETIANAGHYVEIEQPEALTKLMTRIASPK